MLVLGETPQKHGLSKSLLERLYDLYCSQGHVAKSYCANLCTNFRCHRKILDLACQVAYEMPLYCAVPDVSAHPDATFPLQFMCTSLDPNIKAMESSINEDEVQVALKLASNFLMKWPANVWGMRDPSQICFLSPCRAQVLLACFIMEHACTLYICIFQITVARNAKDLSPQMKSVQKVPTYQIQGMCILCQ